MRDFKAIVWLGDQPGERITLEAKSVEDATATLRAEYGDDAVISVWNEEDADRPR